MWNQDLAPAGEEDAPPPEEEIPVDFSGTKVPEKYEILEQIGSGVCSAVRRVKDKATGKEYALKVVTPETNTLVGPGWKSTLKNLKACQHDSVVKLVDDFHEGDNQYLVLEKLPGTAVQVLRKVNRPWTEKDGCSVITQILQAAAFAHSKGLTHGDFTPSNVLAANDTCSAIKIGGFCKCSSVDTDEDLFCEASFKAPEVIDRKKHGTQADM